MYIEKKLIWHKTKIFFPNFPQTMLYITIYLIARNTTEKYSTFVYLLSNPKKAFTASKAAT